MVVLTKVYLFIYLFIYLIFFSILWYHKYLDNLATNYPIFRNVKLRKIKVKERKNCVKEKIEPSKNILFVEMKIPKLISHSIDMYWSW